MIEWARGKAAERDLSVTFIEGDARTFTLDRQFRTVLFPANALCHILTREDFEKLADQVRSHFHEDGRFVIDVFVPSPIALTRDPEGRFAFGNHATDEDKTTVTFSNGYDHASQINHITTYTQHGEGETVQGTLDMRMYYPQELGALLEYNGLPVETRYGTVDLEPYGPESGRQLVVCRKG